MNWFLRLFYTLTGGRPMTREGSAFWDRIAREQISYYRDAFGRRWMATDCNAWFRVKTTSQQ